MRRIAPLIILLVVAGCSAGSDDPAAVTPDQDRQLNQAAAELDINAAAPSSVESPTP
jgi:Tfp pilus assembly protein PilP